MNKTLNCTEYRNFVEENLKNKVSSLEIKPHLVVVVVGENSASAVYVRNKEKACVRVGIKSTVVSLAENITEVDLLKVIERLNVDNNVHGILVQLPVPKHINERKIIEAIDYRKDVDGFHALNVGNLHLNTPFLTPCTAQGIVTLLEHYNIEIEGKDIVILGRSNIVGKPVAELLLNKNATVTICHSKTKNLSEKTRQADILIAAIGRPKFILRENIKEGAVVIDVGINRLENGKLCGDVDFDDVLDKVSYITPVPGGVGLLTVTTLLENTLKAYHSLVSAEQ